MLGSFVAFIAEVLVAIAEVLVADDAVRVNEVERRTSSGCRTPPRSRSLVDSDQVVDLKLLDRLLHCAISRSDENSGV
jgi:hypothetical protein